VRIVLTILLLVSIGCSRREPDQFMDNAVVGYWVSHKLIPYEIDARLGGGQTKYGSGYLLRLDKDGQAVSLGGDFYWDNDSLFQGGEPGITLKIGKWRIENGVVYLDQILSLKSVMLISDRIGQPELDTIRLVNNKILVRKLDTLIYVKNPSRELDSLTSNLAFFH